MAIASVKDLYKFSRHNVKVTDRSKSWSLEPFNVQVFIMQQNVSLLYDVNPAIQMGCISDQNDPVLELQEILSCSDFPDQL